MANHPDLFEHNRIEAEPASKAFTPRHAYNKDNVTLELLENLGDFDIFVNQRMMATLSH